MNKLCSLSRGAKSFQSKGLDTRAAAARAGLAVLPYASIVSLCFWSGFSRIASPAGDMYVLTRRRRETWNLHSKAFSNYYCIDHSPSICVYVACYTYQHSQPPSFRQAEKHMPVCEPSNQVSAAPLHMTHISRGLNHLKKPHLLTKHTEPH